MQKEDKITLAGAYLVLLFAFILIVSDLFSGFSAFPLTLVSLLFPLIPLIYHSRIREKAVAIIIDGIISALISGVFLYAILYILSRSGRFDTLSVIIIPLFFLGSLLILAGGILALLSRRREKIKNNGATGI